MAYYPDLSPCDYFGHWSHCLIAVGWLEANNPVPRGRVSEEVINHLANLISKAVQHRTIGCMMGLQRCGFCRELGQLPEEPFREMRFNGKRIAVGQRNLFIPSQGPKVFVAPSLILHYILEHGYYPPDEFQQAVMDCPSMGSWSYYREMKKRGANIWSWWLMLRSLNFPT